MKDNDDALANQIQKYTVSSIKVSVGVSSP